jgi:hypothetical protein
LSAASQPAALNLSSIADRFVAGASIRRITPLGNGNVNDTFLVEPHDSGGEAFVMQRVNTDVFRSPERVMHNLLKVSRHVGDKLSSSPETLQGRRWEMPRVIRLRHSNGHWVEDQGDFWRGISYIGAAITLDVVESNEQAREVGYGLGMFHHLISDLPADELEDTLEGFHITPQYLQRHTEVLKQHTRALDREEQDCQNFIAARSGSVSVLEDAKARGELQLRPIHGDPKVNNLMMDSDSGNAIALVDLDTVKPGLIHYDIGDCLRSGCNSLGEETTDVDQVSFNLERCAAILEGYLSAARGFMVDADFRYLFDAIRLIPFELGLRFFSDHLDGNRYFKVHHQRHNLQRARVQFQLCASVEAQEREIRELIEQLR